MRPQRLALAAVLLAAFGGAHAATEIQFWHSMEGALGDRVNGLVEEFNKKNPDYQVKAVYKGNYGESMNAGIAAFRAGNAPDILQVFEVGTATMMYAKGAIKPVQQMSEEAGDPIDPKAFIGAVAGYYSSPEGKLVSMPFNSSTVVFYYNKDAFKKAGLDENKPPKTWPEVFAAAEKLKASGHRCALTTSWMSWTQLESFSLWHNTLYATKNNGFDGNDAKLVFNSPLHVKHFENLAKAAKDGSFVYKGRGNVPDAAFASGECAMITGSSGLYARVVKEGKFAFGQSQLPYYADVKGAPQNTAIGGASLWVMAGKSAERYKGVADFFNFLNNTKIQAASHQRTGYLPVTTAAYKLTEASGFYEKHPGTDTAVTQMIRKTTDKSRGIRLGNFVQIRTIIDEETEQIWTGKKTPQQALDTAVTRGNEQLGRFARANK
ncbi:MAG: sn-glycerol-3-phosphate-binding periplasmic protein UgpB [Delftia tsuruhatensis]|nr:MAG: sn-glycerol-3-phosphate-binding periplasmic protein UgpB [Delftia tsuruhatensis]